MDTKFDIVAAVDIGTTKIVAAVGRKYSDGRVELTGIEKSSSTGVKRGVVLNIEETVTGIKEAVKGLELRYDLRIADIYVGMSGYAMRSLTNSCYRFIESNNEISSFDLEQLLRESRRLSVEPGEKIIHVIPQDYSVDNQMKEKNPVGMAGNRLEGDFHVVIGREASFKNIEKCVTRAGLNLLGVIIEPLASSHAVISEEEKEAGVVVVDIGGGTTDVTLFYDGIIRHSSVIPFGGNVITNDIKEGCSVLFKQAEALKVKFGSAVAGMAREDMVVAIPGMPGWEPKEISLKNLASVIQARVEEIIEYVAYNIESSGYYEKLGAGIVITGGGALLKNLSHLFKLKTGLDVRMGRPDRFLGKDLLVDDDLAFYSTAAGLLVSGDLYIRKRPVAQKLFEEPELSEKDKERIISDKKSKKRQCQSTFRKKFKKEATHLTGSLFGKMSDGLSGFFDDKDVKM
ncbi:cell division protein FtsA [Marinilabiliaceae bacterium ANBcel2]|nr:cell division protein FtsA [Marinilabiliaceae bacterium ANBcel2]